MKTILALIAAVSLSSCDTFKNYSPMLSLGFEVGDSKITVGVAPIPFAGTKTEEAVELPPIIIEPTK